MKLRFGRYKIINRIAVGGMAEVFKAETTNGKVIAIKKILPQHTSNQKFLSMFLDEAKIMISLRHPNIVQLFDFGKVQDDYFLAMEWVDGRPLSSLISQQRRQEVGFPAGLACYIMLEIGCGLEYAHSRKDSFNRSMGIVHRDISPPNILISRKGEVKIADFGIAKAGGNISLTRPGVLKGKFSYMSPEQSYGHELDERSDIFSCGTLFYELASSSRLFLGATDIETINNVRNLRIPAISEYNPQVPKEMERIVRKMLQRKPGRRYQAASDLANELEEIYNRFFGSYDREALRGFIQYLYPKLPIYRDRSERKAVIDNWQKRLVEMPVPQVKQIRGDRRWLQWLLIGSAAVATLIGGFFVYKAGGFSKIQHWLAEILKFEG